MAPKEKNIAEVIPALKLPRGVSRSWSYGIPEELRETIRLGDTVKIPFRKKELLGVIASFSAESQSGFTLKDIIAVVPEMGLSPAQLALARSISAYYFVPSDMVLRLMFPPQAKRAARTKISLYPRPEIGNPDADLCGRVQEKLSESGRLLLLHSLGAARHGLYLDLIGKRKAGSQTLLLLPEAFDIFSAAKAYIDHFGEESVAILSSDLTKNQYLQEWQKVRSGQACLVIGTRQAVFAPFADLGLVIADEEHNSSYKQWDQNPRYHGIDVAIRLADIHGAQILLSSPTLSLESYHRTAQNFSLLDISRPFARFPEIIDMDTERMKGNRTFISERLQEALLEEIYAKRQALIFIPRLGEKTIHQCRDCGYIAECPECENALMSYRNKLYCPRCKTLSEPLQDCPKCQGKNISAFGGGSERVFGEINSLFTDKNIRLAELDSSTAADGGEKENKKIFSAWQKGNIDILVGTQMVWKNYAMENLSLIAVIFPEIIFGAPGFRSHEKSRQFLDRVFRLADTKTVIIESRKSDHRYFEEMKKTPAADFYARELESRAASISAFPYPPAGKLIKLLYKHADRGMCMREARWQHEVLKKTILSRGWEEVFEITPPFPAQSLREYGKYRYHVVIRHKNGLDLQVRDALLASVHRDWIIDVDPDEIL